MKFDSKENRLIISAKELVMLAHRGISRPYDTDPVRDTDAVPDGEKVYLTKECKIGEFDATVYGHADRVTEGKLTLLREVTPRGKKVTKEDREQIRGEGFLLLSLLGENAALDIIYFDREGEIITEECETPTKKSLDAFFVKCIEIAEKYAMPEVDRVTKRLPAFKGLKFPYKTVREGQRDFISAAHRAISHGTVLCASLPTGTGKTVSVIYPALRALGEEKCEKVFYLTPKHTTAKAAADCLDLFATQGTEIKACILSAKETVCRGGHVCKTREADCRLSNFAKLPDAVMTLYNEGKTTVTRADFERVGVEYGICPHELSLCYSEICDVIICDFNYLFDPQVYIKRYFTEGGKFAYLIDEAHNLPDRAREMYSAELSLDSLTTLAENPLLDKHSALRTQLKEAEKALADLLFPYIKEELHDGEDGEKIGAASLSEPPAEMYTIVYNLARDVEYAYHLALRERDEESRARSLLLREFFFGVKKLTTALDNYDEKYRTFVFYKGGVLSFHLFCIDTGGVISRRVRTGCGAVFFSATLEPLVYYRSLLGADGSSDSLTAGSPFDPSQLSVSIVDSVSTRYSERERTAPSVCRAIAAMMSARRGNYMVFCPSFEYLELLSKVFIGKYPKLNTIVQKRDMTPTEKREFLDEFMKDDGKYLIGFCVLGGIYSEGVDLVGDRLIGAAVVGIGMPTLSYEREAMREYFTDKYEAGTEYAYIYPGMNKVFQAAGRVIRTEDDRGVILLIDDRFRDPIYKKSIPSLWRGMRYVGDAKELKTRIETFWRKVDEERN